MDPGLLIGLIAGGIITCIAAAAFIGWGIAAMTSPSTDRPFYVVNNQGASEAATETDPNDLRRKGFVVGENRKTISMVNIDPEEQFKPWPVIRQQKNRRRRSSRKSSSRVGSRV
jgi:hypothetical protein